MTSTSVRFDPDRTALVLIEFQREWLSEHGKLNVLVEDRGQPAAALEGACRALGAARQAGLRVIHAGLRFEPGHPELGRGGSGLRGAIPRVGTFVGEAADFVPPFSPEPGDLVVSGRTGASAFAGSNLDALLRNARIETVLLAGFALHVCVESTLRQAHDLGYRAVLVEDACAAFTASQRDHVLKEVVHHFGHAVRSEAVARSVRPVAA